MKGIYLTEEAKAEIEAKIAELKNQELFGDSYYIQYGTIQTLEQLLFSATILPVEESWEDVRNHKIECPSGVIIQPKQEKL